MATPIHPPRIASAESFFFDMYLAPGHPQTKSQHQRELAMGPQKAPWARQRQRMSTYVNSVLKDSW